MVITLIEGVLIAVFSTIIEAFDSERESRVEKRQFMHIEQTLRAFAFTAATSPL